MRRASYRDALFWITRNDDCSWLPDGPISVTAALVADLFEVDDARIRKDLCDRYPNTLHGPDDATLRNRRRPVDIPRTTGGTSS